MSDIKALAKQLANDSLQIEQDRVHNSEEDKKMAEKCYEQEKLLRYKAIDKITMEKINELRSLQSFFEELTKTIDSSAWINPIFHFEKEDIVFGVYYGSPKLSVKPRTAYFRLLKDGKRFLYHETFTSILNEKYKGYVKEISSDENKESIHKKRFLKKTIAEEYLDEVNANFDDKKNRAKPPYRFVILEYWYDDEGVPPHHRNTIVLFEDGEAYYDDNIWGQYQDYDPIWLKNETAKQEMLLRLAVLINREKGRASVELGFDLNSIRKECDNLGIQIDSSYYAAKEEVKEVTQSSNEYLAILSLNDGATEADIKVAFTKYAKLYHPQYGSEPNQELFDKIQTARNNLLS